MAKIRTTKAFFLAALLFLNGCNGCTKAKNMAKPDDMVEAKKDATDFFLNAQKIFAHASHFSYRSELQVTTKQGNAVDEDSELIEIMGAKPRLHLKKKTDSQHFIEIIAENDNYFVRSGGKDFRRGADNNPLYQNLIDDGFNLLNVLLHDFALKERLVLRPGDKKIYTISPGLISVDAPYIGALKKKIPSFNEIVSGDVTGSFTVDEKTGLVLFGNLAINVSGKDDRTIALKANFALDIRSNLGDITMPKIRDDEPVNYPVDIGRKWNEMMGEKESK